MWVLINDATEKESSPQTSFKPAIKTLFASTLSGAEPVLYVFTIHV